MLQGFAPPMLMAQAGRQAMQQSTFAKLEVVKTALAKSLAELDAAERAAAGAADRSGPEGSAGTPHR